MKPRDKIVPFDEVGSGEGKLAEFVVAWASGLRAALDSYAIASVELTMKLRFLSLVSLVALLAQCSQSTGPCAEEASPGNSQPYFEANKDNCDFSLFKSFKVGMMQAPVINLPLPEYPLEAKAKNIAGRVVVKVLIIAKSGEVERACIVEGNDILGNAAKNAALCATFSPYWGNNKSLAERYEYFEATLTYNFLPQ